MKSSDGEAEGVCKGEGGGGAEDHSRFAFGGGDLKRALCAEGCGGEGIGVCEGEAGGEGVGSLRFFGGD